MKRNDFLVTIWLLCFNGYKVDKHGPVVIAKLVSVFAFKFLIKGIKDTNLGFQKIVSVNA